MAKHEKSFVDFDKPYEQNIIGLKGIIYFGVGLFLLCVITFGLMALLLNVLKQQSDEAGEKSRNPMQLSEIERLPPEPRLQAAPGFGIDGPNGRINLELKAPQSEYWELEKIWRNELENGQRDPKTNTVITLPIEEAKKKFLEQNVKAAQDGQKALDEAHAVISDSSGGRVASEKRR